MSRQQHALEFILTLAENARDDLGLNAGDGPKARPTVAQLNRTLERLGSIVDAARRAIGKAAPAPSGAVSESDRNMISLALEIAAKRFAEDARTAETMKHPALAEQFRNQVGDAVNLGMRIAGADAVVIEAGDQAAAA